MSATHRKWQTRWFNLPRFSDCKQDADAGAKTGATKRNFTALLRVLVSLAFLSVLLLFVDTVQIQEHLTRMSVASVVLMVGLHVVIILLAAWRFTLIARSAGSTITTAAAVRLTFPSTLANMLLPTSLAGDAGRIWLVRRFSLSLKDAVSVGVFDRIIGLASLGGVVLLGALFAPPILPMWSALTIFTACVALIAVLLVTSRLGVEEVSPRGRFRRLMLLVFTVALSVSAHLVSIVIALIFLHTQSETVSTSAMTVLFPAVLLAASIPVSVGGWGTREIAAATAFGVIGMSMSSAVAMAFMFGVTQTLAAGLGTAIIIVAARTRPQSDV